VFKSQVYRNNGNKSLNNLSLTRKANTLFVINKNKVTNQVLENIITFSFILNVNIKYTSRSREVTPYCEIQGS